MTEGTAPARRNAQTLLVDADDTLFQNNVYFLEAIDTFVRLAEGRGHDPDLARRRWDEAEHAVTGQRRYGSRPFADALLMAFQSLEGRTATQSEREEILGIGLSILDRPVVLLEGVADTLPALASRHRVIIMTKGDRNEQHGKIERAGFLSVVHGVKIVDEKDAEAYRSVILERKLDATRTWMIGNSPRSDINPALTAGLRTVFIPHARSWHREIEDLLRPPDLTLRRFDELLDHF